MHPHPPWKEALFLNYMHEGLLQLLNGKGEGNLHMLRGSFCYIILLCSTIEYYFASVSLKKGCDPRCGKGWGYKTKRTYAIGLSMAISHSSW